MKYLYLLFICLSCSNSSLSIKFKKEYGFLTKEDLLQIKDSIPIHWDDFTKNDSIAKYVHIKSNYIVCVIGNKGYWLVKFTEEGKYIKKEFYDSYYTDINNFNKQNNWCNLRIRISGSGYGSERMYLFNDVFSQDSLTEIPLNYESIGPVGIGERLTSNHYLKNDTLIVSYQLDSLNQQRDDTTYVIFKEKMQIIFFNYKGKWITNDSEKIHNMDL